MLIFTAFIVLVSLTIADQKNRRKLQTKSYEDWLMDSLGLLIQGILIPCLQVGMIYPLYSFLLPQQHNCLQESPIISFLLSFMIVDYLYYWNHRALHSSWFWRFHQVHHTVTEMDVLGTSRNTVWTSFIIIYLWIHPLFIYLLQDSNAYLLGISMTAILDLWRHSQIGFVRGSWGDHLFRSWLVLPQDHAWHHAKESCSCNFGANFKIWDRWHGTAHDSTSAQTTEVPSKLGLQTSLTLTQKLLFPLL